MRDLKIFGSCIYMIEPSSITTVESRRAFSTLPTKTRSETTVSNRSPPDLVSDTSSGDESEDDDDDDDDAKLMTMSPTEIRVIRRLSARVNVLPVISRSDSLTDEKLLAIKNASKSFEKVARLHENTQSLITLH